jgi:hypothetical protein
MTLGNVPDERNAPMNKGQIAIPAHTFFNGLGFRLLIAVAIFGATLWRYYEPYHPHRLCGTGYESLQLACSLAETGNFSDPFQVLATGPSAHLAPLFPAYVSLLVRFFGSDTYAGMALGWSAVVIIGLHLALLPFLSRHFGLGLSPGVVAASVFLLAGVPPYVMWESFYVALLAILLAFLMYDILAGRASKGKVILSGILWGIMLWMATVPVLIMLAWAAWVFVKTRLPRQQRLILLFLPFLVLAPWLIRNFLVFHHFVFVRDNLGTELAVSNNPCATFWLETNKYTQCFEINHPNKGLDQAERVRQLGEYEYNQVRLHEAAEWIRANPRRFAELTWLRIVTFWFPSPTGHPLADSGLPPGVPTVWLMTLLSIPGLWLMWKKSPSAAGILALWLLFFPLIYYIIQFDPRYRFPILWVTLLLAGFLIAELAKGVWHAFRSS